jgi:DNA-binding NtrC family response regulator
VGEIKESGSKKFSNKVLIIEDSEDLCLLWKIRFERVGFDVAAYDNPQQALELIQGGQEFDILITDFNLQEKTGLDVLEEARQSFPELPCVLVSGVEESEILERMSLFKKTTFVPKPASFDHLLEVVKSLLE